MVIRLVVLVKRGFGTKNVGQPSNNVLFRVFVVCMKLLFNIPHGLGKYTDSSAAEVALI